jgi:hypothetical protein
MTPTCDRFAYCKLLHVPSEQTAILPRKPYLGIYLGSKQLEQSVALCRNSVFVQVAGIVAGSPAEACGLRKEDIIFSVNGRPTCQDHQDIVLSFKKMIAEMKTGSTVQMEVLRGEQKLFLNAQLTEMPHREQPEANHKDIEHCDGHSSILEKTLRKEDGLALFQNICGGLYQRTNVIWNPGAPYEKELDSFQLKEMTYMMRHPLAAGAVARALSQQLTAPLSARNWDMADLVKRAVGLLDVELSSDQVSEEISFPGLLRIMESTKERIDRIFSVLTPEERLLLYEKALRPWDDKQWNDLPALSLKVDRKKLFEALFPLLSFLTKDHLSLLREDIIKRFGNKEGPILYEAVSPAGKVIIGGFGPNTYREDAALILDLGGDDLYLNNAGGARPAMPIALVIDWEGNDRYIARDNFSQGAAALGGGILLDLSGNDAMIALDGSQGAGFWGIGILYHGGGQGIYRSRGFSQGVGQMGIGLMISRDGDDRYLCSHDGQALGLFGGAGILIDSAGRDFYQLGGLIPDHRDPQKSTASRGQGFGKGLRPEENLNGVPGGIGVLIDEAGDDTYLADYLAQGASYYYGVGILDDRAGNDRYIAGRYAQGAGIHCSVGVLLDRKGNDSYYASYGVSQGLGHDFGIGFLEDDQGNDSYWGGTLVQGAATNGSLGILIDPQGIDQYTCVDQGQAFAQEEDGLGMMINMTPVKSSIQSLQDRLSVKIGRKSKQQGPGIRD